MKNILLSALFIALFTCTFSPSATAQDSVESHIHIDGDIDDDGSVRGIIITETETDKSYRLNCRFDKDKTEKVRRYLHSYLGTHDKVVSDVRQVWKHLPDGALIDGLEITLREGRFSIKAKEGCCPGDMEELKAIGEDVKSILE